VSAPLTPTSPAAGSASGLGRSTALMASGTIVSRVLGVLRVTMLVWAIGLTHPAANAFAAANALPHVFSLLIAAGLLEAVLVPQVVRACRRPDGQEHVDRLLTLGLTVLLGVTVVLTIAAPLLIWVSADFSDPALTALAVLFAFWCLPQIFFYGLHSLLSQVLNARGSFGPSTWAPVVNTLVSMVGIGVFIGVNGSDAESAGAVDDPTWWSAGQVALLAGTFTLGVVVQALVVIVPLARSGFRFRPRWGFRGVGLRTAGQVATWTFFGLLIGQAGVLVISRVTTAAAGNNVFDQAFLIFMLPHSVVTVSLMTALLTRLSARAAAGEADAVRADLSLGLRTVGLCTVLATALLGVLAYPLGRAVFPTASAGQVHTLASVVLAMVLGLTAFGAWSLAQRVYYAYEDARSMFPIQVVMVLVVIGGTLLGRWLLPTDRWTIGAASSMSLSYVVGAALALIAVGRRLGGIDGPRVVRTHVKAVVAAGVAAASASLLVHARGGVTGLADAATTCLLGGGLLAVVYVVLLRLMRVPELGILTRIVGGTLVARRGRTRR